MSEKSSLQDERRLMRLVLGEMGERAADHLRRRLEQEPALAARHRRLERVWNALEAPPPAAVPPGFARRTAARVLEQSAQATQSPESYLAALLSPSRWARAPASLRTAAALALVLGVLLGVVLGLRLDAIDSVPTGPVVADAGETTTWEGFDIAETGIADSSLAEQYWLLMDGDELPALTTEEDEPAL